MRRLISKHTAVIKSLSFNSFLKKNISAQCNQAIIYLYSKCLYGEFNSGSLSLSIFENIT